MRRHLGLIGTVAVIAFASAPAVASATSIAGPNGKIVFASGRASSDVPAPADGNDDLARLWVADWPSGTPVQVTTKPPGTQHRHPNWSPDHSKIVYAAGPAFVGPFALWILDLKTKEQTEFVPAAAGQDRPTWSPDGSKIAYGSKGDLWIKGVASGSVAEQITETAGVVEERPVWSPDGKTLYYNRGLEGDRDLYMKSPVTKAGAELPVLGGGTDDWQPAVSPDGKRLCFTRGPKNDGADLWTVNVNGSSPGEFSTSGVGDLNCVWSPDQTHILFTYGAFSTGQLATRDINGNNFDFIDPMNVEKHFDGNADWATNFSPKCDPKSADIGVNQFTTITVSGTDPDFGFGGAAPTPTPLDDDAFEIASQPAHGTIGGLSNGKVIYTPGKDFKGTDTFTYTGTDGVSECAPATVTLRVGLPGKDTTKPAISAVKVSAKRWRRGKGLAKASAVPVGTTISFQLSESARATVTFNRVKPNGKAGKSAGSISVAAKGGRNKVRFQGRLSRSKTLAPGKYKIVVGATDDAGNRAQPKSGPTFTIVNG